MKVLDTSSLDEEISVFTREWLFPICRTRNPYFNSVVLFDSLDFENSKPARSGKLIVVSETQDILGDEPMYVSKAEGLDLTSFLEGGRVFLNEAGLELDLSDEDVDIIDHGGEISY